MSWWSGSIIHPSHYKAPHISTVRQEAVDARLRTFILRERAQALANVAGAEADTAKSMASPPLASAQDNEKYPVSSRIDTLKQRLESLEAEKHALFALLRKKLEKNEATKGTGKKKRQDSHGSKRMSATATPSGSTRKKKKAVDGGADMPQSADSDSATTLSDPVVARGAVSLAAAGPGANASSLVADASPSPLQSASSV